MMKSRLCIFVLAASVAACAQGRSGSAGAGRAGGASSTPASMHDSNMGANDSSMGSTHGNSANTTGTSSRPSDIGKQSPDTILARNTQLNSRLQSMLPSTTTPQQACSGFKNLGQCVAAIHVADNLHLSFDDIKAKMTGDSPEGLGKAIHDLKPDANAKAETRKAVKQAGKDLSES